MTIISRFTPSLRGGGVCNFYYFDPAKTSKLTLNTPFTGELTLLFSTFNGVTGLPAEFSDATVTNAPIGAKSDSSLYEGAGQQVTRTVTSLAEVISTNFDGVLWAYALDGAWYYVNQGYIEPARFYYQPDGVDDQIVMQTNKSLRAGDTCEIMFKAPSSLLASNQEICSGLTGSNSISVVFLSDGSITFNVSRCTVSIDGVTTSTYPTDGGVHRLTITGVGFGVIGRFYSSPFNSVYSSIKIWDIAFTGTDTGDFFYPVDDGWPNNPTIRETIQGEHASLLNGQEDGWSTNV